MKSARCGLILIGAVAVSLLSGCAWLYGARPLDQVVAPEPQMDATRAELLVGLERQALQLHSMTAITQMWAYNEGVVVPATLADNARLRVGKDYNKKFERAQVNASLMMRRTEGGRNLALFGTVVGPSLNVRLLANNDAFWMSLPNVERRDATDSRGVIYVGESQRVAPRRTDLISVRPQDVWDLLFTDELLMPGVVTYMETWPGFYVINFLLPESPERIFSKIWISRLDLTMVVHQIFDGTGQIIAEARFKDYLPVANAAAKGQMLMPSSMMLLWPRDRLMFDIQLSNIKINVEIADKWFEPGDSRQYKVQRIDDLPASSAPSGTKAP